MASANVRELAHHIDRVRRRTTPRRSGVVLAEIPGGWMSAKPAAAPGEVPSLSTNRVYWMDREAPIGEPEIAGARAEARRLGLTRLYLWLPPWAWNEGVERSLNTAGAERWPDLEYIALAREAAEVESGGPPALDVRSLGADEIERRIAGTSPWYSEEGVTAATRLVRDGISEMHAALEGDQVVALSALTMDGDWAYLSAAGTDPAHRGRGAQTAMIAARVKRAAELGAKWCACETNTAVPISLRNLRRCGFEERIFWRVYVWNIGRQNTPARTGEDQ